MQKINFLMCIVVFIVMILAFITPISAVQNSSGPELESYICNGFQVSNFHIYVKNIGDETAHNVHIINATVEGKIYFNFQSSHLSSVDILPDMAARLDTNSMVFGFGNFTLSITVSCDEGVTTTSSVVVLIIGPFILIP